MVKVRGHGALANLPMSNPVATAKLWELGLAVDEVVISPKWANKDIHCDDFGPDIPVEIMLNLAEVNIAMTLIHYDQSVLNKCVIESMAGGMIVAGSYAYGYLPEAGSLMGNGRMTGTSGCHFVSLNLLSPVLGQPWRFRRAYLAGNPVQIPLSVKATLVQCNWRAIPNLNTNINENTPPEQSSSGVPLWDNVLDV